ncbi:MAG: galactose oxidase-like domain-containing protein [Pseudomonadota bacterium]
MRKSFARQKINKYRKLPSITLLLGLSVLAACDGTTLNGAFTIEEADTLDLDLNDYTGPVDHGEPWEPVETAAARVTDPLFHSLGHWSKAGNWPISPIHLALLADGRVLSYGADDGTTLEGRGSAFRFDLWTTGAFTPSSHQTLRTGISTNLFCSAQSVLPDGNLLISGGDKSSENEKAYKLDGVNATTLYDTSTSRLTTANTMNEPRWYPTLIPMPDGRQLVLGGKDQNIKEDGKVIDKKIPSYPEIYNPDTGSWTALTGADNAAFFKQNWFYPRAFLKSDGKVVIFAKSDSKTTDDVYELSVARLGSLTKIGTIPADFVRPNSPAVMFNTDKVLLVSQSGQTLVVDVSGGNVRYRRSADAGTYRIWGNTTILPNGEVFLSGGRGPARTASEKLDGAAYKGQIWNPQTGRWRDTASANKARLYHSTALLLPSARVLIAGGGPPGPVVNKNAERFQPPYLFDTRGALAERPVIDSVGDVRIGNRFNVVLEEHTTIDRVTLIRAGSDTHSFDQGQRFMELAFDHRSDLVIDVAAPANSRLAPPGLYMLFVLNDQGVPSAAKLIMI